MLAFLSADADTARSTDTQPFRTPFFLAAQLLGIPLAQKLILALLAGMLHVAQVQGSLTSGPDSTSCLYSFFWPPGYRQKEAGREMRRAREREQDLPGCALFCSNTIPQKRPNSQITLMLHGHLAEEGRQSCQIQLCPELRFPGARLKGTRRLDACLPSQFHVCWKPSDLTLSRLPSGHMGPTCVGCAQEAAAGCNSAMLC